MTKNEEEHSMGGVVEGLRPFWRGESSRVRAQSLKRRGVARATGGLLLALAVGAGFKALGLLDLTWGAWWSAVAATVAVQLTVWLALEGPLGKRDQHFILIPTSAAAVLLSFFVYLSPEMRHLVLMAWFVALLFISGLAEGRHIVLLGSIMTAGYTVAISLARSLEPELDLSFEVGMIVFFWLINLYVGVIFSGLKRKHRDGQHRYQNLAELAPVGLFQVDQQGRCLYVNDRWCKITGRSRHQILGRSWVETLHLEDREQVSGWTSNNALERGGNLSEQAEVRFERLDGSIARGVVQLRVQKAESGAVEGFLGTVTDISELERARRDLDRLFSLSQDLICVGVGDYLKRVNPAFCRTLGYSSEELLSRPLSDFVHPEDRAHTVTRLRRLLEGQPVSDHEIRFRCRNGSYLWLAWRSISVPEEGVIYSIARDITQKKKAEMGLKQSETNLAEAQRLAHLGSWEYDIESNQVSWSRELLRIFGLTLADREPSIDDFWVKSHPEDRERVQGVLARTVTVGAPCDVEFRIVHQDGSERVIHCQAKAKLNDSGRPIRLVGSVLDITERTRTNKALEQASRAKDDFLANMSHEIRTPMNAIIGMSELVLEARLGKQEQEYIETIRTSADGLLEIIDDILDFSKIEAGKLDLERIDFRLRKMLNGIVELLAPRAAAKGIELRLTVEEAVPHAFASDPTRLRQVLLNLVGNALKFTAEGFVAIRVQRKKSQGNVCHVAFSVTDTGIGIAKEVQPQLFSPFTQADTSTTRRYGGTGLGLAISQRIVEVLGGQLGVESSPGKGATFSFTLPLELSLLSGDDTQPLQAVRVAAISPRERQHQRLLVAEDDPVNQLVVMRQLESLGYRAEAVANGPEALEALSRKRFDLVLMDCQMPGLDGYETTRRIRQNEASGSHLPIIAVTAHAMKGDEERCLNAGMDDYISKPFRASTLASVLDRWLGVATAEVSADSIEVAAAGTLESLEGLDMSVLGKLHRMEPSMTSRLIESFETTSEKYLAELHAALEAADGEAMKNAAHSLRGNSSMLGAARLAELCSKLEKEEGESQALLRSIDGERSRVLETFERQLAEWLSRDGETARRAL